MVFLCVLFVFYYPIEFHPEGFHKLVVVKNIFRFYFEVKTVSEYFLPDLVFPELFTVTSPIYPNILISIVLDKKF